MADELDLLRRANPVPSDDGRFHDRPLDQHAERRLNRLLHSGRPRRLRRWALSVGSAAAVGVVVLTLLLSGSATTPAVAAPRPLQIESGSTPVSLGRIAARAAADRSQRLRQGTHAQTWSLSMTAGSGAGRAVTVPEERVVRWQPDGSSTELVVATDPRRPGRPVISGADPVPRTVEDGHVLSRRTFPPSWSDAPPQATPPHDTGRLRAYLDELDRTGPLGTSQLLDAVGELLDNWTLGSRENAAVVRLLADAKGLRPAGAVTDRLGRPGQAYVYDDTAHAVRRMLILNPVTGAVLGLEDTVTKDDAEFGVRSGDVMSYKAWMR
ncbi:CU044_5270 family protein [Streptomyces sp. NBC_01571]|uniref:CU044_5270 family protein n=1 Tax=Streptomyces sp. NBC_01571 TaxID=2975883 RepID=UPI0022536862|nr:CU044_5270 family protein [Streptomyces sp. NBC_01571]MCX4579709.1 CU044_5270 family protein [Streptomyces sp. NBC_01571]